MPTDAPCTCRACDHCEGLDYMAPSAQVWPRVISDHDRDDYPDCTKCLGSGLYNWGCAVHDVLMSPAFDALELPRIEGEVLVPSMEGL